MISFGLRGRGRKGSTSGAGASASKRSRSVFEEGDAEVQETAPREAGRAVAVDGDEPDALDEFMGSIEEKVWTGSGLAQG